MTVLRARYLFDSDLRPLIFAFRQLEQPNLRGPFEPQFERVFENGFETSLLGLADDVEDWAIGPHQFPDSFARAEEAEHRRAPYGADSIALLLINAVAGWAGNVELGSSR